MLTDPDLLDLLDIAEALLEEFTETPADSRAYRMIQSFRTAVHQRMLEIEAAWKDHGYND